MNDRQPAGTVVAFLRRNDLDDFLSDVESICHVKLNKGQKRKCNWKKDLELVLFRQLCQHINQTVLPVYCSQHVIYRATRSYMWSLPLPFPMAAEE